MATLQQPNMMASYYSGMEVGRQNKLKNLLAQSGSVPSSERQNYMGNLMAAGGTAEARTLQSVWSNADAAQQAKIKEDVEGLAKTLYTVKSNPQSWGAVRQMIVSKRPEYDRILPQQFDPAWAEQKINEARSLEDMISPRDSLPAGIQELNYLTDGLSEEDAQRARRIQLGLDPRAQGSGALTIINQGMTDAVANSEGKISQSKSKGSAEGKGQGVRAQDEITRGLEIAKGVPSIKRGLDLLKLVDTGGLDAARIRAKQAFGIESADEGELSNLVGKAVLSQLRETFGAQFTANEGAELARIEAGLGKNNATNTRLLSNALTLANVAVNRALRMAEDRGDFETVMAINEYLNTDLGSAIESGQSASGSSNKPGEFKSSSGITFTVED